MTKNQDDLQEVIVTQALKIMDLEKELAQSEYFSRIWQDKYYGELPEEVKETEVAE